MWPGFKAAGIGHHADMGGVREPLQSATRHLGLSLSPKNYYYGASYQKISKAGAGEGPTHLIP